MDKNETLSDIIAEMRGMGNYQQYSGDHARVLADRIEAAWKREKAEIEAAALEAGGVVEASRHKPDPDWKAICAKCMEGEIEPKDCEYYGEPNGCNSPIYGEHPKSAPVGDAAAIRELKACKEAVLDFCNVFTLVYPPNDGDCPALLAGAFESLKDAMGIETVEIGKGENDESK